MGASGKYRCGYPFLINKEGITIAHLKKKFIFKVDLKTLNGMEEITWRMMAQESGVEGYVFKGVKKISGFAAVPSTGWCMRLSKIKMNSWRVWTKW